MDNFCIGIVGSRRASVYGLTSAEKISYELSEKGVAVISGLARGIDTAAHKGALKAKGKTVAVLGSGLGNVYPKENKGLFQDIYCSGLVLSEFSIEASPVPYNFPRRNRIISGLSSAIVVVEAAQKSGALITADFALEQGRDVYAVPGPIDRMNSCGVNHLIQQGAKLVAHIDDILEDWNNINLNHRVKEETISNNLSQENDLSDQEKEVFKYIDKEPVHIDALAIKMDQEVSLIHRVLLQLELKRVIAQLPGKNFKRNSKG